MSLQEAASQAQAVGQQSSAPRTFRRLRISWQKELHGKKLLESLDVTVGSLQVTCSRLGISLRRRHVLNCNASHLRVMNGNGTRHDIPNHPPIIARKRVDGQFQISLECGGMRRATALPLTDRDIAQLALAAAVRNVGMTQLLSEVVATAIKKGMIEEILREPSPDPAPQAVPESP